MKTATCSHAFAIQMVRKLGTEVTSMKTGTYNKMDPTCFERFKCPIWMEQGMDGNSESQMVAFSYYDITWGITIQVTINNTTYSGYWEVASGYANYWSKMEVQVDDKLTSYQSMSPGFQEKVDEFHDLLTLLILDGEWGQDKPTEYFEDPMGLIEI